MKRNKGRIIKYLPLGERGLRLYEVDELIWQEISENHMLPVGLELTRKDYEKMTDIMRAIAKNDAPMILNLVRTYKDIPLIVDGVNFVKL